MLRFFTITLMFFASLNLFSQQQFVITKDKFNIIPRNDTLAVLSASALQSVTKPTYGENQTWDYSKTNTAGFSISTNTSLKTKLPNTQTDALMYPNLSEVIAAGRGYYYDEYYVVDESGFNSVSWGFNEDQNYFIGDLTGSNSDSIIFPKQYQTYKSPRVVLKFPSEYGTTTTSNVVKNLNFNLTLTGFGINNGPCEKVSYITQVDKVVGWGSLKVPNIYDINGASKPNNVVLVERVTTRIDSLFLYGQPAPDALMMGFGIEQGAKTTSQRLIFWRADRQSPLFSMYFDPTFTNATSAFIDIDTDTETSVEQFDFVNSKVNVYPNPVQNSFSINIPEAYSNASSLSISDIYGNILENVNMNDTDNLLEFSTNLASGSYFVRLFDKSGKLLTTSKFVVNN